MKPRRRLFYKYVVPIIAIVVLSLAASGGIGIYFSYQETRSALLLLQREKAAAAAARMEQFVREIERRVGWAALPQLLEGGDPLELRRLEYANLAKQVQAISEACYLDERGREQVCYHRLKIDALGSGADLSRDPRYVVARSGKTYFGPVYYRKETEPYMALAMRAGRDGVTSVEVNLKFIWEVVQQIKVGKTGYAYVVAKDGHLVAHPDISLVLQKTDFASLPQVKAALANPEASAEEQLAIQGRDHAGRRVLTAFARLEPLEWTVFVQQPISEAYASLYAPLLNIGLLLLLGLAMAVIASLALAKYMVRPINALREGAQAIGAGNLEQKIDVRTGDELQDLAEQFNTMTDRLRESYAGLEKKVEERTEELKRSLEHQTAISEVLRVISASPTDVQPVLDAVAERAAVLCEAPHAHLLLVEAEVLRVRAVHSRESGQVPVQGHIVPIRRTTINGRSVVDCRTVHIDDVLALLENEYPDAIENQRRFGFRAALSVPLLREGQAIGTLYLWRRAPGLFSKEQVALIETFAAQAVIAIENVRLFNETREALDSQKASGEILASISGSISDTRPVFEAITRNLLRLFGTRFAAVLLVRDGQLDLAAWEGEAGSERIKSHFPQALDDQTVAGRAVLTGEVQHLAPIIDNSNATPVSQQLAREYGWNSIIAAPMIREDSVIGTIVTSRRAPIPFEEKQIALINAFANQAVIAIENARLVTETQEALEHQKATAEILRAISASMSETQGVFETIVRNCHALFPGSRVALGLVHDGRIEVRASVGARDEADRYALAMDRESGLATCIMESRTIHMPDLAAAAEAYPRLKQTGLASGYRSGVFTPLMREGRPIGALSVLRPPQGAFRDKELALLKTFADQAVIAIENVRLFNETRESLEQQKASGEVLGVISSSIADTKPVFDKILQSCERLFAGKQVGINLVGEDGEIRIGAYQGPGRAELERVQPFPRGDGSGSGAAIAHRQVMHYPDAQDGPEVPETTRRGCRAIGVKAAIFAPMLWEGRGIGVIFVGRDFAGPFSEKEIALLRTFSDQAAIAIQNARLFREIQEKSAQLEVANKHKSDFLANMSHELRTPLNAIIGFSEVLIEKMFGEVNDKQLDYLQDIHSSGRHLLSLINDILDLSKIEAGRMDLELADFDLPAALQNSMTLVRERAQRHGIALGLEIAPGLASLRADERKFKQIMLNLLSNAVKFTPEGGSVRVGAKANGSVVEISVTDTGVGIAAEDHDAVFEEFKQVGRDYTRKAEGTGLGLALTKRFVELHGGEIRLASALGQGSTFTFTLPVRP